MNNRVLGGTEYRLAERQESTAKAEMRPPTIGSSPGPDDSDCPACREPTRHGLKFPVAPRAAPNGAERLRSLLARCAEISGVGGWELDLETAELVWTDEARRLHGVGEDFVPTLEHAVSFFAPEARDAIEDALNRSIADGASLHVELPLLRANGERLRVRMIGEAEFEDGAPRRLTGTIEDITPATRRSEELRDAKEWMERASRSGRVGLWGYDVATRAMTWDEQMAEHLGVPDHDRPISTSDWQALLPEETSRKFRSALQDVLQRAGQLEVGIDLADAAGESRHLKLIGKAHRDGAGEVARIQGACFDLTTERRGYLELRNQTSRLHETLDSIGEGVITTDTRGIVTWMNREAERLTGWASGEAVGQSSCEVFAVLKEGSAREVNDPVLQCLRERQTVFSDPDVVVRRRGGSALAVEGKSAPMLDAEGQPLGAVVVFRDVTEKRQLARDITWRATHDVLTGLLNRSEFERRLEDHLGDKTGKLKRFLVFVDLDRFKRVNDAVGHQAGDEVLRKVAQVLRSALHEDSVIGRRGGDGFLVLIAAEGADPARCIAQELCTEVQRATKALGLKSLPIGVGASAGIVDLSLGQADVTMCMRRVEIATDAAKKAGRGQVCFWTDSDASMQDVARQVSLVERIERMIAESAWAVHEQPIHRLDGVDRFGKMRELLIRFPTDADCTATAQHIVGAAERYGMMSTIDLWMCKYGLELIADRLSTRHRATYFVNLSASSLSSRGFREQLLDLVSGATSEVLRRLCLEITETAMVENYDTLSIFLSELRGYGVRIAIDDFGAGYSSFRYFREMPADYLKLDGSFIRNVRDPVAMASIECFIRMARVTGMKTIAEHVESDEVLSLLAGLGVDYAQGYALGYPKPVEPWQRPGGDR